MKSGANKRRKRNTSATKSLGTPKSDMLMSEDMEQGLLSEHHQHNDPAKKEDFYRKKTN